MRKGFLVFLTLALVVGVFISCSNEANEDLTYVEFSVGDGRALVNDVSMTDDLGSAYPVNEVYWYYTARKTDGSRGMVGSTLKAEATADLDNLDNHNPVLIGNGGLSASIGPFSTGVWNFRLYAYDKKEGTDRKLIYTGVCDSADLRNRIASSSAPLSISAVIRNAITTGTVKFADLVYYDSEDGVLTVKSTLTKVGSNVSSLVYDMSQGSTSLAAMEVTDENKPYENAVVGTYFYKVPLFGTSPSKGEFSHISNIAYSEGITTAVMDTGAYRLVSKLYYDETPDNPNDERTLVNTILDNTFIVYPGETKTITGGVYESTYLPYVQATPTAEAKVDHVVNANTYTYWCNSLQDAVNMAASGETVNLLKDLSSVTIEVGNAIEITGIKASAITSEGSAITTYSNRNDLFVYTIKADTTDATKVNLKFYLNPTAEALQPLVSDEGTTVYWLSGTLPEGFVKDSDGKVTYQPSISFVFAVPSIYQDSIAITVNGERVDSISYSATSFDQLVGQNCPFNATIFYSFGGQDYAEPVAFTKFGNVDGVIRCMQNEENGSRLCYMDNGERKNVQVTDTPVAGRAYFPYIAF